MRKIIFTTLSIVCCLAVNAQDLGGTKVAGTRPIERKSTTIEEGQMDATTALTPSFPGPTGNSAEVGITEGALSVSLTGAATYNIPIAVPPGINGVVPQISLTYSSQEGNGLAGYGWNITGISSITRIPSNKFHDNNISVINGGTGDRFALDGQRLIPKDGGNYYKLGGGQGVKYETENFSNIKVTSYNITNSPVSVAEFKVEYPDGSVAIYGGFSTHVSTTTWALKYWENPQGVRISYSYVLENNNLRIASIKYGTMGTIAPINEIQFVYQNRQRPEQAYIGGQNILNDKILKEIKVIGNGIGFRNYYLAHDITSLGYERLISITEKCGDNSAGYNPTVFSYDNTPESIAYSAMTTSLSVGSIRVDNSATVSGDFDGDGNMDFLLYPTNGDNAKKKFWLFTEIAGGSLNMGWEVPCGSFEEIFPSTWLTWNNKLAPFQGMTAVQSAPMVPYINNLNINTYYLAPYGVYLQYQKAIQFPDLLKRKYLSGDFNGDGLTDVIAVDWSGTSSNRNAYFIDLDRRKTTNYMNLAGVIANVSSEDKLETGDFNGDGKTDILFIDGNNANYSAKVYTLNSDNQLVLLWSTVIKNPTKIVLFGDYNGDGKTDFMLPNGNASSSSYWYKYTSTGTAFIEENQSYPGLEYWTPYGIDIYHYIPSDINNDGKTDILYVTCSGDSTSSSGLGNIRVRPFINKNGVFGQVYGQYYAGNTGNIPGINKFALPIFYTSNQPNKKLEIAFANYNKLHYFKSQKDFGKERLLRAITTGNGVKEIISYSPLVGATTSQNGYDIPYRASGYTENYPNTDIIMAPTFQIVSQLEKVSKSVYKKQLFKYYGAVTNLEGLGFLGFRSVMRTNWFDDNGTQIISTVSKNDIGLRGTNIENYSLPGIVLPGDLAPITNYISKSSNTYNMVNGVFEDPLQFNKVYKLKSTITQNFNGLDNTRSETETTYDAYNNPVTSVTKLYKENVHEQTAVGSIAYNAPSVTPHIIGRPMSKTQAITIYPGQGLPNEDTSSSEELYTYTNNLLTQVKKKINSTPHVTEDNEYDSFGNIKKKKVTAGSLTPRETKYDYDPSGRFLIKSYDTENLISEFEFNTSNGVLNWEKNPYLLQTKFFYDKWLKKIKTTDYLGVSKNYTYSKNAEKTFITETKTPDDGSASNEVYDDLGRKIKSGAKNINGNWACIDYLYDIYDRNFKVSELYFGDPATGNSGATQWNETQYDMYGRVSKNITYTGKTITMTYAGLTTTINDGVKTKTSVKNAIGRVVAMTDAPGGTINYTYFANGNLKTSDYGGVITTITLDNWGRKKTLTDPAAGTYEYTYNDFGETLTEKTPKGITTYDLDAVGKVNWKTIVGINGDNTNSKTTNTYDPATKLLTAVKFENLSEGYVINYSYGYDQYKRLNFKDESGYLAYYQQATQFDAFGRPEKELYTAINTSDLKRSDKWIKKTYKNGYHYQIVDDATQKVLWQANTVNERGQLLTAQYGYDNGSFVGQETHSYDTYGLPASTSYRTANGSYSSAVPFMTLTTAFDPQRGNLLNRTNSMFGWSEDFSNAYDQQDRLIKYKDANGVYVTQSYDDRGRITANNIGTYNYNVINSTSGVSSPYQASSVTLADAATTAYYNGREQNIGYNAFKSPVWITEEGKENIDYQYNAFDGRCTMYYGGLEADKTARKYRKFYSADGSMEIKRNLLTDTVEFITYIGGNAYTAPVVLKSDGTTQNYLYLHRDYQGSILAITNANGQVLEKRLFDAWGALIKYNNIAGSTTVPTTSDGLLLDRGYIGHEHLLGVGLINMNARLYDPRLHRFLSPDNYVQDPNNTQSYNRYAYCWNNPLKYADYNGEWFGWDDLIVAAVSFVVGYVSSGIQTGQWGWSSVQSGLISAAVGWVAYNTAGSSSGITAGSGSLNAPMWDFLATSAASSAISLLYPPIGIQINNFSFSISPAIAFGNTSGVGVNLSATFSNGDFSLSGGIGIMSNSNYNGLGKNGYEIRKSILASYDNGKNGFSLGFNKWEGDFAQRTGVVGLHFGDFRVMYENDGSIGGLGDGGDSYRTAALNLSLGDFTAGFNLMTGYRDYEGEDGSVKTHRDPLCVDDFGRRMPNGLAKEEGPKYRLGALTVGYKGYRVGVNSEHIRHAIQDQAIHNLRIPWFNGKSIFDKRQMGFENQSWDWKGYGQYRTQNIFTSW
ncbi:polymorphic toxin type 23 domain-containing protein [Flavobacterium inviolabile]|uniref:polymorphic toxin type 23 domain-containing protein n=1 Tax=Flavobacterium inviolabile TaxID=2748320 RepID=UPI0015A76C0D|nr:polymorphic toxin type 23 domain-containing protein [Flavobacterium inviolabile]